MSKIQQEPLLKDDKNRFVIFPVKHHDIWDWYKKMQSKFWTTHSELNDHQLETEQQDLNANEIYFLRNLLALLSGSQKLVTKNLTRNIQGQISSEEAGLCLDFQITTENIHLESFSLLARSFNNKGETQKRLSAEVLPELKLVEAFTKKWSGAEQYIGSAAFNAIFFPAGVSALLWLKKKDQLPGLTYYSQLISRDKTYHRDFVIDLYSHHLKNKISEEKIRKIIIETKNLIGKFLTQSLPVKLIDMPTEHIEQYLHLVTEDLLKKLDLYNKYEEIKSADKDHQKSYLPEKRVDQLLKAAKKNIDKNSDKVNSDADL